MAGEELSVFPGPFTKFIRVYMIVMHHPRLSQVLSFSPRRLHARLMLTMDGTARLVTLELMFAVLYSISMELFPNKARGTGSATVVSAFHILRAVVRV